MRALRIWGSGDDPLGTILLSWWKIPGGGGLSSSCMLCYSHLAVDLAGGQRFGGGYCHYRWTVDLASEESRDGAERYEDRDVCVLVLTHAVVVVGR